MRIFPARFVAFALGLLASGCSLSGLDNFEVPHCTVASDCDGVNASHGIALDACDLYQCREGQCARARRDLDGDGDAPVSCGGGDCDDANPHVYTQPTPSPEVCDGLDNNCNQIVDEGVITPAGVTPVAAQLSPVGVMAFGSDGAGRGAVAWTATQPLATANFASLSSGVATQTEIRYAQEVSDTSLTDPALRDGCPSTGVSCSFEDLALAGLAGRDEWLVAAVNVNGCTSGQLRLGYLSASTGQVVIRGPFARSNTYLGVDLDSTGVGCTGQSRPVGAPHGAVHPSIAATDSPSPQGLAAWLADSISRPECGGVVVDVEALGVWLESYTASAGTTEWVNATNNGIPFRLGQTFAGGAPALIATSAGYFAAFGDVSGNVMVRHVPLLGAPPAFSPGTAMPGTARPTSALVPDATASIAHVGSDLVDTVALAYRPTPAGIELGVLWRQGCGAGNPRSLHFAPVRYDTAGGTFATPGATVDLPATDPDEITLNDVSDGFVTSSFTRGGVSAGDTTGGWLVAWSQGAAPTSRVIARRIAAFDGALIDEPEIAFSGAQPTRPFVFESAPMSGHRAQFLAMDDAGPSLFGGDLVCRGP